MASTDTASMRNHLQACVRQRHGAGAEAGELCVMEDGHAGLTFGFSAVDGHGAPLAAYVLKLGPAGVRRRGSTDVYRQVRLLRCLHERGLPVPDVVWASPEEEPLGAPYIVMERLPGRTFVIWEPDPGFGTAPEQVRPLWEQAASTLAGLHRLDWQEALPDWESPCTLAGEIERWDRLLHHASERSWLEVGRALGAALAGSRPPDRFVGLVHGDYQPGNLLYDGGRLRGVIDWDLACIGPQGMDVGWLLMMADPAAWAEDWRPLAPLSPDALLARYRAAGGPALEDLAWYQAFAHFRMGAIACLNVKLHRDGRRPDPLWERFAPSILTLFQRAGQLLGAPLPLSRTIA